MAAQVSGNVAGVCFVPGKGGTIVRNAWSGTQIASADQLTCRGNLTTVVGSWSGVLTEENRGNWRNLARTLVYRNRLGGEYVPSGYQVFVRRNMARKSFGLSVIADPLYTEPDFFMWRARVISKTTYLRIAFESEYQTKTRAYGWQIWKAGPFDNVGRRPIAPEYRLTWSKTAGWYQDDLTGVAGKYYWYKCRCFDEAGIYGNFFEASSIYP